MSEKKIFFCNLDESLITCSLLKLKRKVSELSHTIEPHEKIEAVLRLHKILSLLRLRSDNAPGRQLSVHGPS